MLSLHRHSQTERRRVYTENTLHHKLICCIHTVWVGESDHARLIQRKSNPTVSLFCPSTLTSSTRGKRKSERDKNHTIHNKRKESKQRGGGDAANPGGKNGGRCHGVPDVMKFYRHMIFKFVNVNFLFGDILLCKFYLDFKCLLLN